MTEEQNYSIEPLTKLFLYELRRSGVLPRGLLIRLLERGLALLPLEPAIYEDFLQVYGSAEAKIGEIGFKVQASWEELLARAQKNLDACVRLGIDVFLMTEAEYPELLAACRDAPIVLFCRGNWEAYAHADHYLAVVGSRKMTAYGMRFLEQALPPVIRQNTAIISGMARGCDSKAHELALENDGFTVACLAYGLDTCYPPEHRRLQEEIAERGLLISEHAPGVPPLKSYFSARNRLISGLAEALFIVEAGQKSGALITAEFAANQGRDVLVLPGSVFQPSSAGCNRLLRDGATPVLDYGDILVSFGIDSLPQMIASQVKRDPLLQALAEGEKSEMELAQMLGLEMTDLRIRLTRHEAEGMVFKTKGRYFLTSL